MTSDTKQKHLIAITIMSLIVLAITIFIAYPWTLAVVAILGVAATVYFTVYLSVSDWIDGF